MRSCTKGWHIGYTCYSGDCYKREAALLRVPVSSSRATPIERLAIGAVVVVIVTIFTVVLLGALIGR